MELRDYLRDCSKPNCGRIPRIFSGKIRLPNGNLQSVYYVECLRCGTIGKPAWTEDGAAELWNRREHEQEASR